MLFENPLKKKKLYKTDQFIGLLKRAWIGNQRDRGLRPAFPLISCVTLGHALQFCGPQFHQQEM